MIYRAGDLVGGATLIGAKHDGVGGFFFHGLEFRGTFKEFEVGATTFHSLTLKKKNRGWLSWVA